MTKPNDRKGPQSLAMLAWMLVGSYGLYLAAFSLARPSSFGADVLGTIVVLGLVLLATLAFTAQIAAVFVGAVLLFDLFRSMLTRSQK